jgi:2-polyprenyl-3-methyl-5-hydroxy-6-metoxy-1,4-benzoquinol methylase
VGETMTVFDRTASRFAAQIDQRITAGQYARGRLFVDAALRHLPCGGAVLDYGCGPGRISAMLARAGFRVVGIDQAPSMVALAKAQALTGLDVKFLDSSDIAWRQFLYDGVVCSSVIEYVSNSDELLRQLFDILRPTGVLFITFANALSLSRMYLNLRYNNPFLPAQKQTWSWTRFRAAIERAGFLAVSRPRYFESVFDRFSHLSWLSASSIGGELGFAVARKGICSSNSSSNDGEQRRENKRS